MAVPTRAALTTLLCSLPLSSALAGDITDIQGIRGVATEPEARALAGGGALQWWPVATKVATGPSRCSRSPATWRPPGRRRCPSPPAPGGHRSAPRHRGGPHHLRRTAVPRGGAGAAPRRGTFVVYPDGEQLMGVHIDADGAAAEAAALAPSPGRAPGRPLRRLSGRRPRGRGGRGLADVVQADGTVALQAGSRTPKPTRAQPGTKVDRKLARKKTGWDLWAPAFGVDGAVLAVRVHDGGRVGGLVRPRHPHRDHRHRRDRQGRRGAGPRVGIEQCGLLPHEQQHVRARRRGTL